jgi:hypothetical protein
MGSVVLHNHAKVLPGKALRQLEAVKYAPKKYLNGL